MSLWPLCSGYLTGVDPVLSVPLTKTYPGPEWAHTLHCDAFPDAAAVRIHPGPGTSPGSPSEA